VWLVWLVMAEVAGCQPLDQPSRLQPNRTGWRSMGHGLLQATDFIGIGRNRILGKEKEEGRQTENDVWWVSTWRVQSGPPSSHRHLCDLVRCECMALYFDYRAAAVKGQVVLVES
jgi:hypothetical protein